MNIKDGIKIGNAVKVNCKDCGQLLALHNDKGQVFLRHVVVGFFDLHENRCELKCKKCGEVTIIKDLT